MELTPEFQAILQRRSKFYQQYMFWYAKGYPAKFADTVCTRARRMGITVYPGEVCDRLKSRLSEAELQAIRSMQQERITQNRFLDEKEEQRSSINYTIKRRIHELRVIETIIMKQMGYSTKEIAGEMELSVGWVHQSIRNSRRQFKRFLPVGQDLLAILAVFNDLSPAGDVKDLLHVPERHVSLPVWNIGPKSVIDDFIHVKSRTRELIERIQQGSYSPQYVAIPAGSEQDWPALVRRMYFNLLKYSQQEAEKAEAMELLADLYSVLIEAMNCHLLKSSNPFERIRIRKEIFLDNIIALFQTHRTASQWIDKYIDLITREFSVSIFPGFRTADVVLPRFSTMPLREEGIARFDHRRRENLLDYRSGREVKRIQANINNVLVYSILNLYSCMFDVEAGITYFKEAYISPINEPWMWLEFLLAWLAYREQTGLWLREFDRAFVRDVRIPANIMMTAEFLRANDDFPWMYQQLAKYTLFANRNLAGLNETSAEKVFRQWFSESRGLF